MAARATGPAAVVVKRAKSAPSGAATIAVPTESSRETAKAGQSPAAP
ncbi:hypothetical protein ACMS1Z_01710 [Acidiphilium multivorum]